MNISSGSLHANVGCRLLGVQRLLHQTTVHRCFLRGGQRTAREQDNKSSFECTEQLFRIRASLEKYGQEASLERGSSFLIQLGRTSFSQQRQTAKRSS
jgi:hypothetical protein